VVIGLIVWSQMGGKPQVAEPQAARHKRQTNSGETPTTTGGKTGDDDSAASPVTAFPMCRRLPADGVSGRACVMVEAFRAKEASVPASSSTSEMVATSYDLVSGADKVGCTSTSRANTVGVAGDDCR
jgi:hypothetical protein